MISKNVALLGVSLFALAQAAPALAVPSLATDASVQLGSDPALLATPLNGIGYSYSSIFTSGIGANSANASASSDTNYNTRARSNVQGTGISSSNAQWFETITNATAGNRRYSFTFRIDGGTLDVNSASDLQNGNGTAGFEAFFDISRGGVSSNIFGVTRQVGLTTTAGTTVYSDFATNNYLSVTNGTLQDGAVNSGNNTISQSWSNSFFTIDLGELAANESFTLSYLLRSFNNSTVLDLAQCSSGEGYGYGYGQSNCLSTNTRSGDPGEFLDTGDARIGFSSNAVTTDVPEPASLALLGIGLAGMGAARRRAKAA